MSVYKHCVSIATYVVKDIVKTDAWWILKLIFSWKKVQEYFYLPAVCVLT